MKTTKGLINTKKMVLLSLFIALSIVLARFASIMLAGGTIRLGFGNIPIIFAGLMFGPISGAIVGVISDLVGVTLAPQGAFHLGITLSAGLTGLIPGLVVYFMGKKDSLLTITIANIAVYIIVALGLTTYWISQMVGKSFLMILPARAIAQGIVAVISIGLIYVLMKNTKNLV